MLTGLTVIYVVFSVRTWTRVWNRTTRTANPDTWFFRQNYTFNIPTMPTEKCKPDVPCVYSDEVDLRIIVMTYNRNRSLQLSLDSLQDLILDDARAMVEIWIDRDVHNNTVDRRTLEVANTFQWKHGRTRVTIQNKNVGIYGQWIDTWRPWNKSKEIALFLQDDIDISPFAWRWLKAAHAHFDHRKDVSGYSLSEIDIVHSNGNKFKHPNKVNVFLFRRFGTFAFSPHPKVWPKFQEWFHWTIKHEPKFKPFVKEDRVFERQKRQQSMWSMWFEYFTHQRLLYTVFPNIGAYLGNANWLNTTFAFQRQEKGLHFWSTQTRANSTRRLLTHWRNDFIKFPYKKIQKFNYNGKFKY